MFKYVDFDDGYLITLLAQGDEVAFTEIYNRYWDKLLIIAAHRLDDIAEAKELVQNVFVNLWNKRNTLQIKYTLATYLSTAIKYEVINSLAKRTHRKKYMQYASTLKASEETTLNHINFSELQDLVARSVKALPEKCRIVFQLSREQGLSHKQIAANLNISEKTVEAHLSTATRKLRTSLGGLLVLIFLSVFL
jgi:RNA polymerase sigma-70 factor (ECF subfamily)